MCRQSGEILKSVAKTMIENPRICPFNSSGHCRADKPLETIHNHQIYHQIYHRRQLSTQRTRLRQTIQAAYRKFIITEGNKETKTKLYWTVKNIHSYKPENYLNMKSIHHRQGINETETIVT